MQTPEEVLGALAQRKTQFQDWLREVLPDDKRGYLEQIEGKSVDEFVALWKTNVLPIAADPKAVVNLILTFSMINPHTIPEQVLNKFERYVTLFSKYIDLL